MVLPVIPLIAIGMVAGGGSLGSWYTILTQKQRDQANRIALKILAWKFRKRIEDLLPEEATIIIDETAAEVMA